MYVFESIRNTPLLARYPGNERIRSGDIFFVSRLRVLEGFLEHRHARDGPEEEGHNDGAEDRPPTAS